MRRILALTVALVLGFSAAAKAGPLDLKLIAEDAKWAVHMDVDALMASSMMQKAREKMLEKHPEAETHLAMIRSFWKFDPRTDLHGITLYGRQLKKDTGVAIVCAKVDQNLLLEKAKLAPDHRVSTYGKYELHSWVHAKGSRHERSMTGTFYKPDLMIFGATAEEVMAAIDVLDGAKPSLAGKESELGGPVPPGTILAGGVTGLADVELPCKSPLAKQAELMVMAAGEYQGEVFMQGRLVLKQPEIAQQMKTVLDGGLALAALMHGDDANALKLIEGVKVSVADKVVSVEGRGAVDEVWEHMKKAMAKAKEARKDWYRHGKPGHCPIEKK